MDNIRQQLEQIDKQIHGGRNLADNIIRTSPLLFAATGLIVGIILAEYLKVLVLGWILIEIFFLFFIFIALILFRKQNSYLYLLSVICLLVFVCLGGIRQQSYKKLANNDIGNIVGEERKLATIRGVIETSPYIAKDSDWKFSKFTHSDPSSSFYLKITEIEGVDGWSRASGKVRVTVSEAIFDLKEGNIIQAYCWLSRFEKSQNPGQFDFAEHLRRRNIYIRALVKNRQSIEILENGKDEYFAGIKRFVKTKAIMGLIGDGGFSDRSEGLMQALLVGYRGDIDSKTYRAFQQTGLLHLVSLSGLHFGILIGIVWWICRTAGLMKPTRAIICIIVTIIFLLIVPPREATLRAGIITFIFCLSIFFSKRTNPLNSLSLAALVILLLRPASLFEVGWQLSFISVLGILIFTKRIHLFFDNYIIAKLVPESESKKTAARRIFRKCLSVSAELFSVGIAAWIASAGLLLYHFYTITPLASLWTVLAMPFVGLILACGFLKIGISFISPTVGAFIGEIVGKVSDIFIWLVQAIAKMNISEIVVGDVGKEIAIFYYLIIFTAASGILINKRIIKIVSFILIIILSAGLFLNRWQNRNNEELQLNILSVGQGQAIVAQLPGGNNILFDAGSLYKKDIGRNIVLPFLRCKGINNIESIVVSHDDIDHTNGVFEVSQGCNVNTIYLDNDFISNSNTSSTARMLIKLLEENGHAIKSLSSEIYTDDVSKVTLLWPDEQARKNKSLSDNDKSAVVLIEFAGKNILLCSDIEKYAQKQLLEIYPDLKCDVIVVPHHGSQATLSEDFIEALCGKFMIVSSGNKDNKIINKNQKEKWFNTAGDGCISVKINKDGDIKIEKFSKI